MEDSAAPLRARRGRPRKFARAARAVTVTLPEDVLERLAEIDPDIGRAIVRLTEEHPDEQPHRPAELASFGRHAVIVVNPTRTLQDRIGVELVPLPDGRALISFGERTSIADLELKIADALDDQRLGSRDKAIFEGVADILKSARRSRDVALVERNIIVLEARRGHPPARTVRPRRRKAAR